MPAMPVLCVRSASLAFGDRSLPPDLYKIHLLPCFRTHLRTTKVRPRFTPHRRRPALLSAYSPHAISAISAMSASSFASSAREATARSLG